LPAGLRGTTPQSGEIVKVGWQYSPLGEICDVLDRKRKPITKRDRVAGKYPYFGATGILDYVEGYLFDERLILIGEDGAKWSAGEKTSFAASGKYWVNNHAHVIRPHRKSILDQWIIYYLNGTDLSPFITGLTVPKLNQGKLKEIPIPLPPLPEQKRIVAILDEAFAGIDAAIANTEKNLAHARELFESYLNAVFTQKGDEWVVKKLGDVCQIKPPKKEAKQKLSEADMVSFVPMANLGVGTKIIELVEDRVLGKVAGNYTYFAEGDVLLAKITPCFENGKLGIAEGLTNGIGFGSSEFIVFRTSESLSKEFLYYFLSRKSFRKEGAKVMTGAVGHKRVPKYFIENYPIPIPLFSEQKLIVGKLDRLAVETKRLESIYQQKLSALAELKQSILQKAFTGELTGQEAST